MRLAALLFAVMVTLRSTSILISLTALALASYAVYRSGQAVDAVTALVREKAESVLGDEPTREGS